MFSLCSPCFPSCLSGSGFRFLGNVYWTDPCLPSTVSLPSPRNYIYIILCQLYYYTIPCLHIGSKPSGQSVLMPSASEQQCFVLALGDIQKVAFLVLMDGQIKFCCTCNIKPPTSFSDEWNGSRDAAFFWKQRWMSGGWSFGVWWITHTVLTRRPESTSHLIPNIMSHFQIYPRRFWV